MCNSLQARICACRWRFCSWRSPCLLLLASPLICDVFSPSLLHTGGSFYYSCCCQLKSKMKADCHCSAVNSVIPRASLHNFHLGNYDWHIQVITMHAKPLRKSIHFLHQYMSPFTMLPSVLFYKEGLYISTQHSSIHWHGSPITCLPHHHLVRVEIITSILVFIVSILL
jgi:hypothetical protein